MQEEHQHCERLLQLARENRFRLAIPAFSLAEPLQALHRRHAERADLQQRLDREVALLARSASFEDRLRQAAEVMSVLDESRRVEQDRLDQVLEQTSQVADIIPLNAEVLAQARVVREEYGLRHPDAVVLASVLLHIERTPDDDRIFIQRDRKDFLSPDITGLLRSLRCDLLGSFQAGVGRVEADLTA